MQDTLITTGTRKGGRPQIIRDCCILLLVLYLSASPAVMGAVRMKIATVLVSALLGITLAARKERVPVARFIGIASIFGVILALQCLTFNLLPVITIAGFMLRLFIGYAAVVAVADFPGSYVRVMACICGMSLVFHLLAIVHCVLGLDLLQYFSVLDRIANPYRGYHIIVHNFLYYARMRPYDQPDPFRNSSFFWEPGVFATYILVSLVFLGSIRAHVKRSAYRIYLLTHLAALVSTLSTTGFLALPLVLLFHVDPQSLRQNTGRLKVTVACVLLSAVFGVGFWKLDFIGAKIKNQWEQVVYREESWETTRIGSLVYDVEYIKRRPLLGWGLNAKTRYMLDAGEDIWGMGNGLSDFVAKFGLIGLAAVLASVWFGASRLFGGGGNHGVLFVIFFVVVLNGERLLDYPASFSLLFLGLARVHRRPLCAPALVSMRNTRSLSTSVVNTGESA